MENSIEIQRERAAIEQLRFETALRLQIAAIKSNYTSSMEEIIQFTDDFISKFDIKLLV